MHENDKPTTVAYWVKLTLVALALCMLTAFYVFVSLPQSHDASYYVNQAVKIMTGSEKTKSYFLPPGRSYCLIPFFLAFGHSETTCKANEVVFDLAAFWRLRCWRTRCCAAARRPGRPAGLPLCIRPR